MAVVGKDVECVSVHYYGSLAMFELFEHARIAPFAKDYMIASHVSKEPAAHLLLAELGKEAFLHCDMCLGEGTGAIMLFPILDQANAVYRGMATFDEAQIETYVPLT